MVRLPSPAGPVPPNAPATGTAAPGPRDNAYREVNEELILLYQRAGQFLSEKSKEANYGDDHINSLDPWRMSRND